MSSLKKILFILTLTGLLYPTSALRAQEEVSFVHSYNLSSLLLTSIDLEGEFKLGYGSSLGLRAFFTVGSISDNERNDWSPYGVGCVYRQYLNRALTGLFFSVGGNVICSGGNSFDFFLSPKAELGYRFFIKKLALTLFGEADYYAVSTAEDNITPRQGLAHVLPGKGVGLGVGFRIGWGKKRFWGQY